MTREETKVYEAAKRYVQFCTPVNFGLLVTAVMDVPMSQWPKGTCAHKPEHVLKSENAYRQPPPKLEPGDAAYPDKLVSLETGEKKEAQ